MLLHFIHAHWPFICLWLVLGIFSYGYSEEKFERKNEEKRAKGLSVEEYSPFVEILTAIIFFCFGPLPFIAFAGAYLYRVFH